MHRIALGQLSSEDRSWFHLIRVEPINPEYQKGTGREVVGVVEGTQKVVLVVLAYVLHILCLICPVEQPRINGLHQQPFEPHWNHHQFIWVDSVLALVIGIFLYFSVQNRHFLLVLQQKGKDQGQIAHVLNLLSLQILDCDFDIKSRVGKTSSQVIFHSSLIGLVIVFEEEYAIVLRRQIFQFVPRAGFKTFKPLELSILVPQNILSSILHLILKFQLVLLPHMHLNPLLLLLQFVILILLDFKVRFRLPVLWLVFHLSLFIHLLVRLRVLLLLIYLKILDCCQEVNILGLGFWKWVHVLGHCWVLHELFAAFHVHR